MSEFGTEMTSASFALRGSISRDHAESISAMIDLAREIVSSIDMKCSHPPQITDYPAADGKPSPGFLVLQPIIESAILIDCWPPLQACYIHVISCKPFMPEPLWKLFVQKGLEVRDVTSGVLSLD